MTSHGHPIRPTATSLATATAFVSSFAVGAIAALALLELSGTPAAEERPRYIGVLAGATVAVLAFAFASFVGFRLTDADAGYSVGNRRVARVFVILMAAALVAGTAAGGIGIGRCLLVLALSAAALALQTTGARRITELTVLGRRDGQTWLRLGSIPTLLAGAITGIAVVTAAPAGASPISTLAAICALTLVRRVDLHRR